MHAISVGSLLLAPLIETHHRIDDFQVLSVQLQSCPDPAMSGAKYKFEKEIVSVKFGASWGGTAVVRRGARVSRLGPGRALQPSVPLKVTLRQSAAGCLDHTAVPTKPWRPLPGRNRCRETLVELEWKPATEPNSSHMRRPFCPLSHVVAPELRS